MKIASHLMVSRHGVYYLRFVIPQPLRPYFQGRGEIRKSLGTRDPRYAKFAVKQIAYKIEKILFGLKARTGGDLAMGNVRVGYDLVYTPPQGGTIKITTDPKNPEDHKQAMEALQALQALQTSQNLYQQAEFPFTVDQIPEVVPEVDHTLSQIASKYFLVNGSKWKTKTRKDYESIIRKFTAYCGDPPINKILAHNISDYKVHLRSPREGQRAVDDRRVDFCISALHGFFKYAKTSGYYSAVELPTTDQQILKKSDRNKMGGYKILSDDDLKLIFDPKNLSLLIKPHEFWMPILGLFTGARINELAQLGIGDVYQSGEIYVIRIAVNGDDTKSVKTDASNRIVPLHKAILEAGFLDYLDDVRKLGKAARRVFPYLAYHDGGYAKVPGDAFGRYMDSLGLDDKNKVFHSLRKTMNNRMKELGVPEETRSQLLGHKYVSTNSTIYSVPHDIQYLKNVIDKLYFEGVDTSKIKYQPGQFLKILKSEMARRQRELNHKAAQQRRGL